MAFLFKNQFRQAEINLHVTIIHDFLILTLLDNFYGNTKEMRQYKHHIMVCPTCYQ